jgi:glucose/arabinose dehydrogenase
MIEKINKLVCPPAIMMYHLLDAPISLKIALLTITIMFTTVIVSKSCFDPASGSELIGDKLPTLSDPSLRIELIFQKEIRRGGGTLSPVSSLVFLGVNDILLLNKNEGTVNRIVNGSMLDEPLLDVNVANKRERGMLGIAATIWNSKNDHNEGTTNIFLFYTESEKMDGSDTCRETYYCIADSETIGNHLYRYELRDNKLVDPKLLLNLPAWPAPAHNGGIVKIGPDNNVYITVGDFVGSVNETTRTKAQNYENGTGPDGRAGILRVTQDGKPVEEPILGKEFPLNLYYAYGIRNSFGIDFDPLTHKLWDTENGPDYGDEINLVEPGFNSGWNKVQGIWKPIYDAHRGGDLIAGEKFLNSDIEDLVIFNGNGKYSEPEFTWNHTAGPTQITFLNSDKFPEKYKDDLFVGDTNNGYLYNFDLNENRTSFILKGALEDMVADNPEELDDVILGQGFGHITDIEVGPDGYLYVLSHNSNTAMIFKITSNDI